ncbi:MAG: coaE [Chloroflexi bacterium]|nr:coaE [Chloroflexota bacterium]
MTDGSVRIGITGPIGCGKSTVAGWLRDRGAAVIDADQVAREVVEPGEPALAAVLAEFGPSVRAPDGRLDRAALGRMVFADPAVLRRLEAIIHPAVRPRIEAAISAAEADGVAAVAIEAIKLVEGGLATLCDEVWLITCNPIRQLARVVERGLTSADAAGRIRAQGDLMARLAPAASRVIDTTGSMEETLAVVDAAYRAALGRAKSR